jgi:hypothetical protein
VALFPQQELAAVQLWEAGRPRILNAECGVARPSLLLSHASSRHELAAQQVLPYVCDSLLEARQFHYGGALGCRGWGVGLAEILSPWSDVSPGKASVPMLP